MAKNSPVSTGTQQPTLSQISDANLDAFGRVQIGNPVTLFDSKQVYDNQPLFWDDQEVSGGGTSSTYSQDRASSVLDVDPAVVGKRIRQTFRSFNYQPGKAQQITCTGVFRVGDDAVTKELGYFNDDNGVFFRQTGDTMYVVQRSSVSGSPVDTAIAQEDWNIDVMDGAGPSGVFLDPTKANIYGMEFQWLGVGNVFMGVKIGKTLFPVHVFENANNLDSVYMSTPNLPLRYSIESDGTGGAGSITFEQICSSVISSGGEELLGVTRAISSEGVQLDANTAGTLYAALGMRLKSNSLSATVFIESISALAETNDDFEVQLVFNPTVAGTFTYADKDNSVIQESKGATANTVTGGTLLYSNQTESRIPVSSVVTNVLTLGAAIDGTPDEIVLCVRPLGANLDIQSSINYRELI